MVKGWHFVLGDKHYWVGAESAAEAKSVVSNRDKAAASTEPDAIPASVVQFFRLKNGMIIAGRVISDWIS
jgi:hypothetical protein